MFFKIKANPAFERGWLFYRKLYNIPVFNKKSLLLIFAVFIVLAVAGISAIPMGDGFSHNLPDGSCASSVAKILPCSKDGFQADILIGLFLLLAISLLASLNLWRSGFLLIANSLVLAPFSRANGRFFEYHSFSYKIKANRWLALFAFA